MTVTVFGYLMVIRKNILRFYFPVFTLVLVSIEKIYQTIKTVFDHISKHLEVRQNTPLRDVLFSPLSARAVFLF